MTSRLAISIVASFVAGGTVVWFAEAPGESSILPLEPTLVRAIGPSATTSNTYTVRSRSASGDETDPAGWQITDMLGRTDPQLGIEWARSIEDSGLRSDFLSGLYLEWARSDAGGFLADLPSIQITADSLLRLAAATPLMDALKLASEADPIYAFEVAERYRGALGVLVRSAALEALASTDPAAALDHYREFEGGEADSLMLQSLATGYVRADLDGAANWLSTLGSNRGTAYWPVIRAVALVDLPRAIELDADAMALADVGSDFANLPWLRNGLRSGHADVVQVADQLWRSNSKALLGETLAWWAQDDPYGTIAWIHTKDTISSLAVGRIARDVAGRNLTLALNLGDQFSPAIRAVWLERVLSQGAYYDSVGVFNALAAYRGESFYDSTLNSVISRAKSSLAPTLLADLVGNSPPPQSARQIANGWAEIDPLAAAEWAISLDESARPLAVGAAIHVWHRTDPIAAFGWWQEHPDVEIPEPVIANLCRRIQSCTDR